MSTQATAVQITDLRYAYPSSPFRLQVDHFSAHRGERIAITGRSGCGKTTLLRLATGLLQPGSGSVEIDGAQLGALNDRQRRALRIKRIGSIPQELDLLEYLSVAENIFLPYYINRALSLTKQAREEGGRLLSALGLEEKVDRFPHQLSQGERQRVAIARSLITRPEILVADEPTGNLDGNTARQVLELIDELITERGTTFLMVTHDLTLLECFDRQFEMENGSPKNG